MPTSASLFIYPIKTAYIHFFPSFDSAFRSGSKQARMSLSKNAPPLSQLEEPHHSIPHTVSCRKLRKKKLQQQPKFLRIPDDFCMKLRLEAMPGRLGRRVLREVQYLMALQNGDYTEMERPADLCISCFGTLQIPPATDVAATTKYSGVSVWERLLELETPGVYYTVKAAYERKWEQRDDFPVDRITFSDRVEKAKSVTSTCRERLDIPPGFPFARSLLCKTCRTEANHKPILIDQKRHCPLTCYCRQCRDCPHDTECHCVICTYCQNVKDFIVDEPATIHTCTCAFCIVFYNLQLSLTGKHPTHTNWYRMGCPCQSCILLRVRANRWLFLHPDNDVSVVKPSFSSPIQITINSSKQDEQQQQALTIIKREEEEDEGEEQRLLGVAGAASDSTTTTTLYSSTFSEQDLCELFPTTPIKSEQQ